MAEDSIIQRMGFEAGPAIASINSLRGTLDQLNTTLGATGKEIRGWNTGGKGATKMFDKMQKAAEGLLKQYGTLAKAQSGMVAGTGGAGAVLPKGGVESQLGLIQKLTSAWGAMPATAGATTKQAFAQGQANLAQFAAAHKMTAQQVVQAFTTMGVGSRGTVGQMGRNFNQLAGTHKTAAAQINQANQSMLISFGTLFKIMSFRAIISSIGAFVSVLKEGVTAGADFSRQLGMIQTVAGAGFDLSQVSSQLEELSRQFASPLGETASAYYLILQNQVGGADNAIKVLTESMKLSVATGATAKEAADTLTVAINGMGLGFENTADIGGKLFKAVEIGRFEFKEMGNVLGMLGPLSRELGVGFEEILGPIATMTRSGVSFTKAVTQMRAILSQTLKPTEKLKEIFKEWGVEDAEQAIKKFGGLLPMLKELELATHGSTSELAQSFTNLRALSGSVTILGKNYKDAVNDTNKIAAATGDLTNKVAEMVQATAGMKFNTAVNEIKTSFANLGKTALPILNELLGYLNSILNIISRLSDFKDWIKGLRGAPVEAEKLNKELIEQQKEYESSILDGNLKIQDARLAANKEIVNSTTSELSKLQVVHAKSADRIIDINKVMTSTLKGELNRLITLQTKLVTKYTELADTDGAAMVAARTKQAKSAMAVADKEFGFQISGLNNVRKVYAQTERSQDRMILARRALSKASTPEDYSNIEDILSQAATFASSASSSAEQEKNNRVLLYKTREQELRVAEALNEVDKQRLASLAKSTAAAEAKRKTETATLNIMKDAVKTILETTSLSKTDKTGKRRIKTGEEIAKDAELGEKAWTKLLGVMTTKGIDIDAMIGLGDLRQKLDASIKGLPTLKAQISFDYKTQLNALAADGEKVRERFGQPFMLKYNIDPTNPFVGLMEAQKQLLEEQEQLKPAAAQYQTEIDSVRGLVKARAGASSQLNAIIDAEKSKIKGSPTLFGNPQDLTPAAAAYKKLLETMQALGKVDPTNLQAFNAALKQVSLAKTAFTEAATKGGIGTGFTIDPNVLKGIDDAFATILQRFRQAEEAPGLEAVFKIDVLEQRIKNIQIMTSKLFPTIPGQLITDMSTLSTAAGTTATNTRSTNTAFTTLAPNALITASAYERIATASQNIKIPSVPATAAVTAAKGGYMRFATGGKAQGTDTIPAMLSPGEFVVNARSTRQFYSQLVAMNAGVKPIYRQDGGSVTNVGDINVSVNGSSSTRQTAREIATALRREVRRGTSKL